MNDPAFITLSTSEAICALGALQSQLRTIRTIMPDFESEFPSLMQSNEALAARIEAALTEAGLSLPVMGREP